MHNTIESGCLQTAHLTQECGRDSTKGISVLLILGGVFAISIPRGAFLDISKGIKTMIKKK